jgi:hypothetical protein
MGGETKTIEEIARRKKSVAIICEQMAPVLIGKSVQDALLALSVLYCEVARNEKVPKDRSWAVFVLQQTAKIVQTPK